MSGYRILIVEDDPLVSAHLEAIISRTLRAVDVVVSASTAEAAAALRMDAAVDFACLDVDVLDGKTYGFASRLSSQGIPFAFISASDRALVPEALRGAPFIAKPYTDVDIIDLLMTSGRLAVDQRQVG